MASSVAEGCSAARCLSPDWNLIAALQPAAMPWSPADGAARAALYTGQQHSTPCTASGSSLHSTSLPSSHTTSCSSVVGRTSQAGGLNSMGAHWLITPWDRQDEKFSEAMVTRFFQPFLGGIFFDRSLRTTSRLFSFVMRCLATGSNCLPSQGIGAVSSQMAARLPEDSIRTGDLRVSCLLLAGGIQSAKRCLHACSGRWVDLLQSCFGGAGASCLLLPHQAGPDTAQRGIDCPINSRLSWHLATSAPVVAHAAGETDKVVSPDCPAALVHRAAMLTLAAAGCWPKTKIHGLRAA